MIFHRKPTPNPQPAPPPRAPYVKIMAQVYNEWTLQIEAPSDEAYVCLADWIRIVTDANDGDEPGKPRVVGFSRTPPKTWANPKQTHTGHPMTENPVCQCGETMDVYHGYNLCPHCDQSGCSDQCPACRKYQYRINIRLAVEFSEERRRRRENGQ